MKILIAEDDLVSRNFLSQFLARYGDCDLVVDGLEALDAFLIALKDRAPYQLILLDIMMPKADGMQVLKAIRALERQSGIAPEHRVKVIMATALAEAQLVRTALPKTCRTPRGVRGLKPIYNNGKCRSSRSHPTRGAWIETKKLFRDHCNGSSHPTRGAWIETAMQRT